MCLAVPGKILSLDTSTPDLKMAKVDFGGVVKDICIEWVDANIGSYILVHAGLAIAVIDEDIAKQTLHDYDAMIQSISENKE